MNRLLLYRVFSSRGGVATLPTVLMISGIVMEIAIAGAIIATLLSNAAFSDRLSAEGLSMARAGAQDAIIKVVRHKNCDTVGNPSGCPGPCAQAPGCPEDATLVCEFASKCDITVFGNNRKAETSVVARTEVAPVGSGIYQTTINSVGTAVARRKKVQVKLVVDVDGRVQVQSFKEIPF